MLASALLSVLYSSLAMPSVAGQGGSDSNLHAPAPAARELSKLVRAASGGDHAAFSELYQRFARAVHAVVLTKVPAQDAGDIVQDVFATAYGQLARLSDPKAFPGWIMVIARRRAVDHVRQRSARLHAGPSVSDHQEAVASAASQDTAYDAERALAAIRSLPEAYAETMMMRLVEGLTGPEISKRTGMEPGSVRVNLCRGMALLRQALAQEATQ